MRLFRRNGYNPGGTDMRGSLIATVTGLALLAFSAGAFAQDAKAEKGAKVYADQKCSLCHSIAGKGNAKGSLDDVGSKLKSEEIHDWIVKPAEMTAKAHADRKPPMPAKYASLPKDDLDALVAYLSSLKKK
jgi:mono/diheme cytochrome c family protein